MSLLQKTFVYAIRAAFVHSYEIKFTRTHTRAPGKEKTVVQRIIFGFARHICTVVVACYLWWKSNGMNACWRLSNTDISWTNTRAHRCSVCIDHVCIRIQGRIVRHTHTQRHIRKKEEKKRENAIVSAWIFSQHIHNGIALKRLHNIALYICCV